MSKKTHLLLERLKKVECPDTTFIGEGFPIVMHKGRGMHIRDVEGQRYLDFNAGFGVAALGHRPQITLRGIRCQAARLIHGMGDVHPTEVKIKLLELIAQISPFEAPKCHLSLSGGDAVETALKTALLATKRSRFLCFAGGYHGLQFGPLALNHRPVFTEGFESWIAHKSTVLPFPYDEGATSHKDPELNLAYTQSRDMAPETLVLSKLEDHLKTKEYAAVVLEPWQGRGGKRGFSKEFLLSCKDLCQKYGSLLIFDEVYTGLGRTGKMFACEHSQVVPDLLCIGKALGGGLPISACLGPILDVWGHSAGEARHTQTFLGHPLACHVAYCTVLEIRKQLPLWQEELLKIDNVISKWSEKVSHSPIWSKTPFLVRGLGFMRGLWFYTQPTGFALPLMESLLKKGLLVLPEGEEANVLALTPPLISQASHWRKALHMVETVLEIAG